MSALVVPVNHPGRPSLVSKLINSSRRSSLSEFATVAEIARDPPLICRTFQSFLREYGRLFRIPVLYTALGRFAGIRIVEAVAVERDAVAIEELASMLRWLDAAQMHTIIIRAIQYGVIRGRIDMLHGCVHFLK
jgi:hypothetical protein